MPLGEFLFEYLHRRGVRHSFGVPGDFALPTFAWLENSPIQSITMTHEPGAGFAADAYSRLNGIGLVCVTYCVGGLNVLNAIAGAYAEKSPVVVVSGAPGRKDREKDPLLHHKVKTFETQRRVYDEVTVASHRPARRATRRGRDRPLRRSLPAAQAAGLHRSAARHGGPRNSHRRSPLRRCRKNQTRTRSRRRWRKRSRCSRARRSRSSSRASSCTLSA